MISNCGRDERGQYYGGQAGDQDRGEWKLINWYNYPWYCVLRHPDEKVRKLLADYARAAALNDNIGYDQWERLSFLNRLKEADWNPANITVPCEADCSSGVTAITIAVGNVLNDAKLASLDQRLYTGNMRTAFKNAGFEVLTEKKYKTSDKYLLPGDILLNDSHHTAINLDLGSAVVPSQTEPSPAPTPTKSVSELANEVIQGKWGNGQERIDRLTAAGYNASEIQNEVNKILGVGQKPSEKETSASTKFKVVNVTSYLNVRSGPGTNYSIVGKMYNGDEFSVDGAVETRNNFTKVSFGKWVSSNYISKV